jgi:glycolate oxidase
MDRRNRPSERSGEEIMAASGAGRISGPRLRPNGNGYGARRAISGAVYDKPKKPNEDVVVPRSRIPDILRTIEEIGSRHGLLIANFGHAGDGNIHTNIMIDEADFGKARIAVREIFEATLKFGGSISGEHGIGISKAAYLSMELDRDARCYEEDKQALDPNNILNPGKIFPKNV